MKLKDIKNRMKGVAPFLTMKFNGRDNVLVEDGHPLSVVLTPPSIAFIVESGHMTTMILRYSETYKNQLDAIKDKSKAEKSEVMSKILEEISDNVTNDAEEQAKQLSIVTKLGREYLIAKTVYGYYGDEKDRFKLVFGNDQETVNALNAASGDNELAVLVDALDDMELLKVGLSLTSAMPAGDVPNIPFVDLEAAEDGVAKEEVTSTAPADRVASFPRSTRGFVVEDVPPPSSPTDGDSFDESPARSEPS